jgi:hypothetical protein
MMPGACSRGLMTSPALDPADPSSRKRDRDDDFDPDIWPETRHRPLKFTESDTFIEGVIAVSNMGRVRRARTNL